LYNNRFGVRFEVFYGDCPLCLREIGMLRWLDPRRWLIRFTDITDSSFDPVIETGLGNDELMAEIYGRLPSGKLVKGVEVFRRLYSAVGLGFLLAPTAWSGLRFGFDKLYTAFAKNRLRLTGRCADGRCSSFDTPITGGLFIDSAGKDPPPGKCGGQYQFGWLSTEDIEAIRQQARASSSCWPEP